MNVRKVCMIGDFAVGKTSLVRRFVCAEFGEQYLTTVGVKIDTKMLTLPSGDPLKLVLWDIAGKSELARFDTSYLRDAAGYLLVVDSTRPETFENALDLQQEVEAVLGAVPFSVLLNKVDLTDRQRLSTDQLSILGSRNWSCQRTSALNGEGVERAFGRLGERLVVA